MSDAAVVFAPASPFGKFGKLGSAAFSAVPPTIAEINASSDWSQVFMLHNRRSSQIYHSVGAGDGGYLYPNSAFATPSTAFGHWPKAANVNALRASINQMRADLLLSSFAFGPALIVGQPIKAQHLTDLRDALSFSGVVNYPASTAFSYERDDNPFGTITAISSTPNGALGAGEIGISSSVGSPVVRFREGFSFFITADFASTVDVSLRTTILPGGSINGEVFASNSLLDYLGGGTWWSNLDNLVFSGSIGATATLNVSVTSYVLGISGQYRSFVAGGTNEINNVNVNPDIAGLGTPFLHFDFGF